MAFATSKAGTPVSEAGALPTGQDPDVITEQEWAAAFR